MTNQLTHAGTVVFRKRDSQIHYLVVSSSDGINWVVPKGHIDPGETPEIAALRELAEEAGVLGEIVASLSARDFVKNGKAARVQFFLIRETGSTDSIENRAICWEEESAARQLLTFDEAREALNEGATIVNRMDAKS
jgi:8-oxo-dGTP pyrophosphatase MutT (NUDIX family)